MSRIPEKYVRSLTGPLIVSPTGEQFRTAKHRYGQGFEVTFNQTVPEVLIEITSGSFQDVVLEAVSGALDQISSSIATDINNINQSLEDLEVYIDDETADIYEYVDDNFTDIVNDISAIQTHKNHFTGSADGVTWFNSAGPGYVNRVAEVASGSEIFCEAPATTLGSNTIVNFSAHFVLRTPTDNIVYYKEIAGMYDTVSDAIFSQDVIKDIEVVPSDEHASDLTVSANSGIVAAATIGTGSSSAHTATMLINVSKLQC